MDATGREFIRQRAGGRCEYCRLPEEVDEWPFHVEHIIAQQHGGDDALDNTCWSCSRCNLYKGTNLATIDLDTGQQVNLFHPRKDVWYEHFAFEEAIVTGLTPVGRGTIRLLNMNDSRRVEFRAELIAAGLFEV